MAPRPFVMGTTGEPSRAAWHFVFLPKDSANGSTRSEKAAGRGNPQRNDRRLHLDFIFRLLSPLRCNYQPPRDFGGFTTLALPTISISESPGIHSTAMQARDGALGGREIASVDFVQSVVLRFVGVESGPSCRCGDPVGQRQAKKNLKMINVVHGVAGTLDRLLERLHGAGDVLFERIRDQNVIVLCITAVGPGTRNVMDAIHRVMFTTRGTASIFAGSGRRCACGGSLMGKQ